MIQRQSVIRQARIEGTAPTVWRYLTEPSKLARWFADTDRFELGRSARFDFGDGDFFAADIVEMNPPTHLRLRWKFMGVGDLYDIQFYLDPQPGGTEVTVVDFGASCAEDAESLQTGWADFLGRLRPAVETGREVRYRWTETIAMAAKLPDTQTLPEALREASWWADSFPKAGISALEEGAAGGGFRFRDGDWGGLTTTGSLRGARQGADLYLRLVHEGWRELGSRLGLEARREYAGHWSQALASLEAEARRRLVANAR